MFIQNVTEADLERALAEVNRRFSGNIIFNRHEPANRKRTSWNVTLKVCNSSGPGAHLGPSGRRTPMACWHVHGLFVDALPSAALIQTRIGKRSPGDPWQDEYRGGMHRVYESELCLCGVN